MKRGLASFLLALLITSLYPEASAQLADRPPNVVFILADDLGWSELGCYGNDFNETPHLDQLAASGVRFTQAYAAAPVCSPYRAALLTGQHPARIGILDYLRPNSANALSTDLTTLPEVLQKAGYATGMIGKWHLTGYRSHDAEHEVTPRDHGFDWDIARERKGVSNGVNFWPYLDRKQQVRWLDLDENRLGDDEFLVDRMNLEAVDFIQRNKDRPFFLYLSHYATHSIVHGKPNLVEKYRKKHAPGPSSKSRCVICDGKGRQGCPHHHWATDHNPHLAAMLESIDDGVGMITDKLHQLGLTDNTIVIFTSDNGGETNVTSNAPLRGGKSQLYEGGIRVPMIVRWPAQTPRGRQCPQPTMNVDFYPTLLEATGIRQQAPGPQPLDGASTLTAWRNPSSEQERTLHWHYPLDRPHFLGGVSGGAIRHGNWKLIQFFDSGTSELYNLDSDPSEQQNLSQIRPKLVAELQHRLAQWQTSVEARWPSPPLLAEARQLYFADHFSSGRASERWWFNADWAADDGILTRGEHGDSTTRIFLRDVEYQDAIIRFDFQMRESQDLRLVTGGDGHYNAVIHIRPDHFFIQTATDPTGPYFSYHHGECAFDFRPDRWYTMTVEFVGDQLVAALDHQRLAYAKHPIINKRRTYFALQVDDRPAAFDNVQIFNARQHAEQASNLTHIKQVSSRYPVQRPVAEQFEIQKRNAHEWHYQRDAKYRELVRRVDELDARKKSMFPTAFETNKEARKKVQDLKEKLLAEDPQYKELLHATHRANRAIDSWLFSQQEGAAELPDSRRRRELENLRRKHSKHPEHKRLVAASEAAMQTLEKAYPQLFITDQSLKNARSQHRKKLEDNQAYRQIVNDRAAAYREQQDYLFSVDKRLAELKN